MPATIRHALPFIVPGQAQKEMTHNEALAVIDLLLHPRAETMDANVPPDAPRPGECHVVGDAPTGEWEGQAGALAGWTTSGWRFAAPLAGLRVTTSAGGELRYDGTAWTRIDAAIIAVPEAGDDLHATVVKILAALQHHGIATPA